MASDDPSVSERQRQLDSIHHFVGASVPHNQALGLSVVELGAADATLRLPYAEHLVGNPATGVLHGGAVTTLLDATCGIAVFVKLARKARIVTLDLRIDYLKPATPGQALLARAECYKLTRSVAFVRALAHHGDPEHAVASAQGTFMIVEE